MLWLALAFLGPISWAASTHIDKYLVEKYFRDSNTAVLMIFTAIVGVIALPLIWLFQPSALNLPIRESAVVALSGAMYMGAMLFYLRAIQSDEASVVAPLFQFSTVFTLVLAWMFLHELLSWTQLGGVLLILIGAVAVSVHGRAFLRQFKLRLVFLMAVSALIVAASTVLFKYFAVASGFWETTFWMFAGEAVFGAGILCVPSLFREFVALFGRSPGAVVGINAANELVNLGGGLAVRFASLLAPVALVSAVSSTTTLFVFAFGVVLTEFFPALGREDLSARNLVQKGVSALLVTLGVLLANSNSI
ncbi:MAG TPA: DMT family transporter [Micropepsaceae bacterium]|nr:DMT family transporter [Micropepsaceae bacterium]